MTEFSVPFVRAKARPRVCKTGHAYTPAATRKAEERLRDAARASDAQLLSGPVALFVDITHPAPKRQRGEWAIRRPDVDNVCKLVMDSLIGICYDDDSQVASLTVTRHFDARCETRVRVEAI